MELDHVGIATTDGDSLVSLYADLLGAERVHREDFDGMAVTFLDLGNAYFELLEPVEDDTTVGRYLENDGPGMHHVAFETDDIDAALETARELGIRLVDEESRPGAWGHEVAFLHPADTGGVLVEFVQH